jgi:Na+/proline symporter
MSSADTMFNAIASVVTADLARLVEDADQESLWVGGRALTVAVALCAIGVGAQGYSVLELFLTADLLAAAVFVPFLAGLYTERLSGPAAIAISLVGIAVGAASSPMLRGLLSVVPGLGGALPTPSLLAAFVGATFVPAVLTAAATALSDPAADLDAVDREVRRLDEPVADGGRDAAGSNGGADPTATDGSRDASTTEGDGS